MYEYYCSSAVVLKKLFPKFLLILFLESHSNERVKHFCVDSYLSHLRIGSNPRHCLFVAVCHSTSEMVVNNTQFLFTDSWTLTLNLLAPTTVGARISP